MFNKKSASKTNTTGELAELAAQATRLEEAGNWGDAAQVWQRIGSHKNASKKTRGEAKGRAAAARVRAGAKSNIAPPATDDVSAANITPPRGQSEPAAENESSNEPIEDAPTPVGTPADVSVDEPVLAPSAPEIEPAATDAPPTTSPTEEQKPHDARLPEIGTVIQKRDRKGELRCECKIVEGGIEYKGTVYKSLSAAALAASKDLGLGASTLDGWSWWGLKTRPAQPAAKKSLGEALERAFSKYRERACAIVKDASGDDLIKVSNALKAQAAELVALVEPGDSSAS